MPQLSLHSPLGPLTLTEEEGKIISLDWGWGRDQTETPLLCEARDWLDKWFDDPKASGAFPFPLEPFGTPYQKKYGQLCALSRSAVSPPIRRWLNRLAAVRVLWGRL